MAKTIWITGMSGAGKTSIGKELYQRMKVHQKNLVFLDGDHFRGIMGDELGHDLDGRVKNAFRIARMCHFLNSENIDIVCSTMSLYPEVWQWSRSHITSYIQVYVRVEKDVLMARDQKGLYSGVIAGTNKDVVGMDLPFNEPISADLIVDNSVSLPDFASKGAVLIESFLKERGL